MTDSEVARRAHRLGVQPVEDGAFKLLIPPGCNLAARGGTWGECFARLKDYEPLPVAATVQRNLFE